MTAIDFEVDGEVHANQTEHNAEQQAVLATAGMPFLRIPDASVERDQSGVLETIRAAAREEPPPRPTVPGRTPAANGHSY